MLALARQFFEWLLSQNQQVRNDCLVIDSTRHWLTRSNLSLKKYCERTSVHWLVCLYTI